MRPVLKIALATAAFGALHSALASRAAKRAVARLVGETNQRTLYRPFYIAQSMLATGALLLYIGRFRTRTLYQVHGLPAWLLRGAQLAALVHGYAAAREVGIARISGLENLLLRLRGAPVPIAPVAQGPEMEPVSQALTTGGPFRWSRHPLNLTPVPVFWLSPKLTEGRLSFNLVATLYLILGSVHEERRLRDAYGEGYERYRRSGVPFFVPLPRRLGAAGAQRPQPVVSQHLQRTT